MTRKLKIALLGKSSRLDALLDGITRSAHDTEVFVLSDVNNIGLSRKGIVEIGNSDDPQRVTAFAKKFAPDFAVIGPEEPLAAGIVDLLRDMGIPAVGPTKNLARVESSKSFTRRLIDDYAIDANPEYREFHDENGILSYMKSLKEYAIKPDGLTGGKGVRVFGDHFNNHEDGLSYCKEIFAGGGHVLIEEKLDGEEFTLQAFCDGETVVDMIPVQDHKRLRDGDEGPNTGGMGSYSCSNHLLPFLTLQDVCLARSINKQVADALRQETGEGYRGILYGGFIKTKRGIKVIEYNARFGDPESLNVLPLLKTDLVDICLAIIRGSLEGLRIEFDDKATVCKYVVPIGYPATKAGGKIDLSSVHPSENLRVFYGAVEGQDDRELQLTGSRAVAFVGIADNLSAAEQIAERAAASVRGDVFHRRDIGTEALIEARVTHMAQLMRRADSRAHNGEDQIHSG